MYADGNYSVLTFCDHYTLFSLTLMTTSIELNGESHNKFNFTEEIFKDVYLAVEGIKKFNGASGKNFNNFIYLVIFRNVIDYVVI